MYLEHFGLRELPFSLTPNTSFFYDRGSHKEALNVLLLALKSGEGFIKITGEVGTGKTLICRKLLNSLGEDFVIAYIPDPFLHAGALRRALATELGLSGNCTAEKLTQFLTERLLSINAQGKRVVVLLDEAQALPDDSLEAVRLLTNLETERHKLLQVVLFGQPELDQRLDQAHLRQLKQRITFSYRLHPLNQAEVREYLQHRLRISGFQGGTLFSPWALRGLATASRGIPRLVNILAHKALMAAYGEGMPLVQARHLRRAVRDTDDTRDAFQSLLRPLGYGLGLLAVAAVGLVLLLGGRP